MIIASLPDSKDYLKKKLSILLNFDKEDFDEAFQIIKLLDLSQLSFLECMPILDIIHYKEAWDFETIIITKLLEKEEDEGVRLNLSIQLLNAYINLNDFFAAITLGEILLNENYSTSKLSPENIDAIIINTIFACLERSKFDNNALEIANNIFIKYPLKRMTFEFKLGVEADLFLRRNEPQNAFNSIIEGVSIKKELNPLDYAKLYFKLIVIIGNQIKFDNKSETEVVNERFIKIKNKEQWYYIGQDNELDAIPIRNSNIKYPLLINKNIGEKIVIHQSYSSVIVEEQIEYIFPVDKYIFWKTINCFHSSVKEGVLDGVYGIEVPQVNGSLNLEYLMKFLNDVQKDSQPFFELYCQNEIPLSFLAISEGGLLNAIGRIQQERKGFIKCSSGLPEEFETQKAIARLIIENNSQFYIDVTSALFLAQSGLLQRMQSFLPNLRVPQSVINFLANVAEKHRYTPWQAGYMGLGYNQQIPSILPVDKEKEDVIQSNLINSIKVLEANPENIDNISLPNKLDWVAVKNIPSELCDACVLAQHNNLPLVTEDYLYLKLNEHETKTLSPKYCSSLALVKVMSEKGIFKFIDYLDYFNYLALHRFRFLSINPEDIEKAIFGDGVIGVVYPENIKKFNFYLTLSEAYGLQPLSDVRLIFTFFLKILKDETITVEVTERIFLEILEEYPSKFRKIEFGQLLLRICIGEIQKINSEFILLPENKIVRKKVDKLIQTLDLFKSETKIWKLK